MKKVRMTLRVISKLDELIKKVATETGKTKNAVIVDACWEFIERYYEKRAKEEERGREDEGRGE